MTELYLEYSKKSQYPNRKEFYHPHKIYPEYPWGEKERSQEKNDVYEMLRNSFIGLDYDKENSGTKAWNPLKHLISPGDTVLIKPNWVSHCNKNKNVQDHLHCLVTHPSIIRAIVDYVSIALKGSGRIILGDAPMQGTDLDSLFKIAGYDELFEFLKEKNLELEIVDFRRNQVKVNKGILEKNIEINPKEESMTIDLKDNSWHFENDHLKPKYKVSDYLLEETMNYHSHGNHAYVIHKKVLSANLVINVPKPKCHRLAGITGALKNMVGITFNKESLPHRKIGDKASNGDAYLNRSVIKRTMESLDEKKLIFEKKGNYQRAKLSLLMMKGLYVLGLPFFKDKYRIGSWYGNDTIWRTVLDLNKILIYADKKGTLCPIPQRKIMTIGDMIVCGEGDGPIAPTPKKLGMILISNSSAIFDFALTKIMGFDDKKIPLVSHAMTDFLKTNDDSESLVLKSNLGDYNQKDVFLFKKRRDWFFEAHQHWK